ncbi:MAG: EVE domain-containing protein [Bdellovibrionales bacterium]|nr:EVE domain-containing protein [Bdellovibrionales bacterium]
MNWLFKTEPETYSFDTLAKDKKTVWNGVRNFQARNFLNKASKGEYALIYHSGKDKAVVGVARVAKEAYPEPDPEKPGDWVQLDISYALKLKSPVTLAAIKSVAAKSDSTLKNLLLIKQSRLSCMPIGDKEFKTILELGDSWADFQKLK